MNEEKDTRKTKPGRVKKADQNADYTEGIGWDAFLRRTATRWARLSGNDLATLDQIAFAVGNYDGLVGRVRERYRLNEREAAREVEIFVHSFLGGPKKARQHGVS